MEIILKLENFEGPLDLLLHLIDKKKVMIADIKMVELIDEYLEIINSNQGDSLTLKSDFVVTASELLEIKALDLIRSSQKEEKEREFKRRLEEYKMFKDLQSEIAKLQNENNISFSKEEGRRITKTPAKEYNVKDLKQMDLFVHYQRYIDSKEYALEINLEREYSIEEEIEKIYITLANSQTTIDGIFAKSTTKLHTIYLFLALLEMYKEGLINIDGEEISIRKKK